MIRASQTDLARNVQRLLARRGWTAVELARAAGLAERTIRGLLKRTNRPHRRTLTRVATALGAPVDELFQDPSLLAHRLFDRRTNPVVEQVVAEAPELFRGWTEGEFDNLYSRFGAGGALTAEGARQAAKSINRQRELQWKVAVLMETGDADLLAEFVELLYRRAIVPPGTFDIPSGGEARTGRLEGDFAMLDPKSP